MTRTATITATLGLGGLIACAPPEANISLYDAIRIAQLDYVETYLADGGDPNGVIENSPMGAVALLKVAAYGHREEIVLALLRAGARADLAGLNLSDFSAKGMDEALTILLADRALSAELPEVKRAIESAVTFGYYDATEVLLTHLRDTNGATPDALSDAIGLSIGRGYDDIARLLLEYGAPATSAALRAASLRSSPGLVRHLLRLGADPFQTYRDPLAQIRPRGRNGFAAIDFAWEGYQNGPYSHQQSARFKIHDLMAAGATSTRFDAPSLAIDGDLLLAEVADPSDKLRRAAQWGMYDAIRGMLSAGAVQDPAVLAEATVFAIDARFDDIARLLLESGGSPHAGPLHMAVRRSSPGIVRHLLDLGADPNETVGGYTPAQYWWRDDPGSPEIGPLGGGSAETLYELIVSGASVCWLGEHRDELAEHRPFALSTLLNTASACWPEDQAATD